MKQLNKFVTFVVIVISNNLFAQTEGSAFTLTGMGVATPFATDYQALGINPGNLDLDPKYDKMTTIGFAEFGLSLYSEVLTKPELRQNLFKEDIAKFSLSEKRDMAVQFANSDNSFNADIMSIGFSINTERAGTFAFTTRDRANFYSKLGSKVSEIMWLGYYASYFDSLIVNNGQGGLDTIPNSNNLDPQTQQNIVQGYTSLENAESLTQLIQGTKFGFSWFREFNLGWGKKILERGDYALHGGLGLKFIVGQGMLDITAENGKAVAFSAMSPLFDIDYGTAAAQNPSAYDSTTNKLKPVGYGYGLDLGTTLVFKKKLTISVAVNDIGKINWNGNLYKLNDVAVTSFDNAGLESTSLIDQVSALNGSDGILSWQGESSRTTQLPTSARIGVGYEVNKMIRGGIDIVLPISDGVANMQKPVFAVGGEFTPFQWVHIQAGYTQGGNYGVKIPVGIFFTVGQGTYECGIASRDFVTFFRDNKPTISMATGFLRFRF